MSFQFELPQSYSFQDQLAMNQMYVRRGKLSRLLTPVFRVCMTVVGIAMLGSGISWLGISTGDAELQRVMIFTMLFGLLWLYLGLFNPFVSAWLSSRRSRKNIGAIHITADKDGMTVETRQGTAQYKYDAFSEAWDYRNRWFLFMNGGALVLPKAALVSGDPYAFADFWLKKTKNPIRLK